MSTRRTKRGGRGGKEEGGQVSVDIFDGDAQERHVCGGDLRKT